MEQSLACGALPDAQPAKCEQIKWCCFKPLSVGVVGYAVIDN